MRIRADLKGIQGHLCHFMLQPDANLWFKAQMVALQTSVYTKLAELVPRGVSRCGAQCSPCAHTAAEALETACGGNCT
jgi:hypothetical protein